jgi:ADP-heptose:LPS heptosyltransferase
VLGIGASHPDKDWPDAYWAEFVASLCRIASGTIFLIGGAENSKRAQALIAQADAPSVVNACDLALTEAAALLRHADIFVGANSGPMNLAAATATDAFGLFGTTPVLSYSRYIHPIVPEGGPSVGGMQRILPAQVLAEVEPYLSANRFGR